MKDIAFYKELLKLLEEEIEFKYKGCEPLAIIAERSFFEFIKEELQSCFDTETPGQNYYNFFGIRMCVCDDVVSRYKFIFDENELS